jgi:hypothetical protein
MKLRSIVLAATMVAPLVVATAVAAPQLASAASTHWVCGAYGAALGGVEHWDAPGVGNTFSWNNDYPLYGQLLTTTVGREVTTSTLALVSVAPATGWTAVVEKPGPPKIVVQYTNTGGGGGAAPNTLRFRTFFSVNPNSGRMAENVTECVPAT